jgi:hypothetical protein
LAKLPELKIGNSTGSQGIFVANKTLKVNKGEKMVDDLHKKYASGGSLKKKNKKTKRKYYVYNK